MRVHERKVLWRRKEKKDLAWLKFPTTTETVDIPSLWFVSPRQNDKVRARVFEVRRNGGTSGAETW